MNNNSRQAIGSGDFMADSDYMKELTLDIYIISRCTHNYYARELKKIGLTMGQFPFLMAVFQHDGISQEKLSARLMISKSTTAVIIQQLLNMELVSREVDSIDRRNYNLHITDKGLALIPLIEKTVERCHQIITDGLSSTEIRRLTDLNRKVRNNAEASLREKRKKRLSDE